MSLTNRKDRFLDSLEIDKWLATSEYIIQRNDGRDTLCYMMLRRVLMELKGRRRAEKQLLQAIEDLSDSARSLGVSEVRSSLGELASLIEEKIEPEPIQTKPAKFDKRKIKELIRADAIQKLNDKILKPAGFVLVLHYSPKDLNKEGPISATFEVWEG